MEVSSVSRPYFEASSRARGLCEKRQHLLRTLAVREHRQPLAIPQNPTPTPAHHAAVSPGQTLPSTAARRMQVLSVRQASVIAHHPAGSITIDSGT